jgi:hypothetical protein
MDLWEPFVQSVQAHVPQAERKIGFDSCMRGDPTLFIRGDEVEAAWTVVTPIPQAWAARRGSKVAGRSWRRADGACPPAHSGPSRLARVDAMGVASASAGPGSR